VPTLLSGYEDDPERDRLGRLLSSWVAIFGNEAVTVKHVVDLVDWEPRVPESTDPRQVAVSELEDVLREIDQQRNSHTCAV